MHRFFLCWAVAAFALGCTGIRNAAHYDGRTAERAVSPEAIRDEPVLPIDYERLGHVSARCALDQRFRSIEREWLSDVDCSERRLQRAMRERAAEVGGELLVGLRCSSHPNASRDIVRIRCRADVARASDELKERRPLDLRGRERDPLPGLEPEDIERLDEPVASEAWRIRVHFVPAPRATPRPPRRADQVRELAELPVNHIALGDISTRCEKGCSRDSARNGLRLVAARMGARALVAVRCTARESGVLCVGTAADYAVDPEQDPRAR